ncbi:MAG: hypothetical protein K8R87_14645 [Verrucomicrobia bacterium]|nr:hypothetical protein [Verrucomicrobiota bacterium]
MSSEKEQARLVDFEIMQDSVETVQVASPWQMVRFVLLGLVGLALFLIVLGLGVMLLIPALIFVVITKVIGSFLSSGSQRR